VFQMPLPLYFPRRAGQQLHAFRLSFADWVDRYRKKRAEEKALSLSLKDIEDEDNKKKMQVRGGPRVRGEGFVVAAFGVSHPFCCLHAVLLSCCADRSGQEALDKLKQSQSRLANLTKYVPPAHTSRPRPLTRPLGRVCLCVHCLPAPRMHV